MSPCLVINQLLEDSEIHRIGHGFAAAVARIRRRAAVYRRACAVVELFKKIDRDYVEILD